MVKVTAKEGAEGYRVGTIIHQRNDGPSDHYSYKRECQIHRDDTQEYHLVASLVTVYGLNVGISSAEMRSAFVWAGWGDPFSLTVTAYAGDVSASRTYRIWWTEDYALRVE
jgi:hypothetical protein